MNKKEVWFVVTDKVVKVYNTRKEALNVAHEMQAKKLCFPLVCVRYLDLDKILYGGK